MSLNIKFRRFRSYFNNNNVPRVSEYIYTGILLATHLAFAINFSTLGPSYVDLTFTLNSSIERVSLVSTFISVGNVLGTLFGMLYKYLNRQLIIIGLLTVLSISCTAIPFTRNIWQLYGCAFIYGTCATAWITAYNVWLIEIWQHNSSKLLFLSQLMYGSGAVLGPLLDSPYLTGKLEPMSNTTQIYDNTTVPFQNITHIISMEERRSKLKVPFMISGGILLISPVLLFLMFCLNRYVKSPIKYENTPNLSEYSAEHNTTHRKVITIVLLSICVSTINVFESVYFSFGSTYFQYSPVKLSAQISAKLVSVMSAAYTIGQVINFFVSFVFRTEYIIGTHFVLSFVMFSSLFFAQNSANILWFISAGIGLSVSVLFPAVLGFFGKYLNITDRIATIVWICCGLMGFMPPVLLGQFIETQTIVFILIEIIFLIIAFLSFVIFICIKKEL